MGLKKLIQHYPEVLKEVRKNSKLSREVVVQRLKDNGITLSTKGLEQLENGVQTKTKAMNILGLAGIYVVDPIYLGNFKLREVKASRMNNGEELFEICKNGYYPFYEVDDKFDDYSSNKPVIKILELTQEISKKSYRWTGGSAALEGSNTIKRIHQSQIEEIKDKLKLSKLLAKLNSNGVCVYATSYAVADYVSFTPGHPDSDDDKGRLEYSGITEFDNIRDFDEETLAWFDGVGLRPTYTLIIKQEKKEALFSEEIDVLVNHDPAEIDNSNLEREQYMKNFCQHMMANRLLPGTELKELHKRYSIPFQDKDKNNLELQAAIEESFDENH
ncbi:hypothetical protein OAI87_00245 [Paracoccaceae bacterium]|nr:hypothetical protein [Paracoccaceae bacterium]